MSKDGDSDDKMLVFRLDRLLDALKDGKVEEIKRIIFSQYRRNQIAEAPQKSDAPKRSTDPE